MLTFALYKNVLSLRTKTLGMAGLPLGQPCTYLLLLHITAILIYRWLVMLSNRMNYCLSFNL